MALHSSDSTLGNSINRPASWTMIATKQIYTAMTINNVIPAIWEKRPVGVNGSKTVYIQHKNASTHFGSNYVFFLEAATILWMDGI